MSEPHCCPVCDGRGIVPSGFYGTGKAGATNSTAPEICKTCRGTGVLWSVSDNLPREKKE